MQIKHFTSGFTQLRWDLIVHVMSSYLKWDGLALHIPQNGGNNVGRGI